MITDYKGPSNRSDLWQYLVGETITGTFPDQHTGKHSVVLILSSGGGVEIASNGSFWPIKSDDLQRRVSRRVEELTKAREALGVSGESK